MRQALCKKCFLFRSLPPQQNIIRPQNVFDYYVYRSEKSRIGRMISSYYYSTTNILHSSSSSLPLTTPSNLQQQHKKQYYKHHTFLKRNHATEQRRSPYAILKLRTKNASKEEIKQSFRALAKQYHPDLSIHNDSDVDICEDANHSKEVERRKRSRKESEILMSELIEAYGILMSNYDSSLASNLSNRVALACEMFTIKELEMDRNYSVYNIRIKYDIEKNGINEDITGQNDNIGDSMDGDNDNEENYHTSLSSEVVYEIQAHPEDSVADLKRLIQNEFSTDWPLSLKEEERTEKKKDRDGIYVGWELVSSARKTKNSSSGVIASCDNSPDTSNSITFRDEQILGSHFFLTDYYIRHNDVIHAVIIRDGD